MSGKRPTMTDVAEKAGVSRALVSIVFRNQPGAGEETRERVLRVADEIGYRPDSAARLLARGRSRTLGVMFIVHQIFHTDLIEGIYPEAERLGYDVLLSATTPARDEAKAIEALLSHRCEGLILLAPDADPAYLDELGHRTATVSVGRRAPRPTWTSSTAPRARAYGRPWNTSSNSVIAGSCTSTAVGSPGRPNGAVPTGRRCVGTDWSPE